MAISNKMLDELIGDATTQEDVFGKDGLLKVLAKRLIERMLESEMDCHLGYEKHAPEGINSGNSRNGTSSKKVILTDNKIDIKVPRDRKSEFTPQLIEKRKARLSGVEDLILSLYGKGMTVRDIQAHVEELYNHEISKDLVSTITDGIIDEMKEWRNRPLDSVYPIIFIDGFVVKCRLDKVVCNRTVYVIFGIDMNGEKHVLGLSLGESEGAKYWLSVLTELKNRGLNDIFILCADGLKGLPEAVEASFPKAIFQTCVVHMVRHSLNYVPYTDKKAVAGDLKKIYSASTVELAEEYLDDFESTWGEKYAAAVKSWRDYWSRIIPFFDYPSEIRKVIYTTNIIESLNRTLRKSVKNRGHFPTENAVMKVLYLAIKGVSKRWNQPIRDWKSALNQFAIRFNDRFPDTFLN
jgi:putative transposase